jgi:hypothetical protein
MGSDYIFDEDDNSIEIDPKNITWNVDMHGYPVYEDVVKVQADLKEQQLREHHADLKKAYDDYQVLLEKYGFWDKITK